MCAKLIHQIQNLTETVSVTTTTTVDCRAVESTFYDLSFVLWFENSRHLYKYEWEIASCTVTLNITRDIEEINHIERDYKRTHVMAVEKNGSKVKSADFCGIPHISTKFHGNMW